MLLTLLVHGLHTLREPPLHSNSNGSWKESEGAQFLKPSELKDHLQQNNFKGHLYLSGACSPVKRARWLCVHRGDPEPHRTLRALCDLKCERELEPQRDLEPSRDLEPPRDFEPSRDCLARLPRETSTPARFFAPSTPRFHLRVPQCSGMPVRALVTLAPRPGRLVAALLPSSAG